MGIGNLFKSEPKKQSAIALDIGTEFVKALIFEIENGKGIVTGAGREHQNLSDMQGGAVTDIAGVIKNCEIALSQAAETAGHLPKQVIMGIAGELVKGATTTIRYSRGDSAAQITFPELGNIIERVQKRAFERARSLLAWETGHSEIDVRLVNAAVTDVKIDGYRVTNPMGFQGKEVEIGVFNAFAPIVHLGALQTIADQLGLDLISIAAEPYAVSQCLGPNQGTDFSAIFIDIGGGTTDVAVVSQGGVVGTKMFAIGGRAMTRRISQDLDVPFAQAEKMKIDYSAGEGEKADNENVAKALKPDIAVWLSGVDLTLSEFSNIELLPSRILLCGGGSNLKGIKEVLENARWDKKLPFAKRPSVHLMDPSEVTNLKDQTKTLNDISDVTPLALANLAIELVGQEGVVEGILNKVAGSLRE